MGPASLRCEQRCHEPAAVAVATPDVRDSLRPEEPHDLIDDPSGEDVARPAFAYVVWAEPVTLEIFLVEE